MAKKSKTNEKRRKEGLLIFSPIRSKPLKTAERTKQKWMIRHYSLLLALWFSPFLLSS